jgi:hypothetical protein
MHLHSKGVSFSSHSAVPQTKTTKGEIEKTKKKTYEQNAKETMFFFG